MSHDQHGCLFALQSCPMNGRVTGLTMSPWPGGWVLLWWMGWGSAAAVEMRQYPALQHTRLPIHLQCNWKSLFIRPWAVLCKANCAQFYHPLCACHGIFKIVQNCMINCLVYMWEVVLQKKWLDLANLSASFEWKISLGELLVALFDLSRRSNTNWHNFSTVCRFTRLNQNGKYITIKWPVAISANQP